MVGSGRKHKRSTSTTGTDNSDDSSCGGSELDYPVKHAVYSRNEPVVTQSRWKDGSDDSGSSPGPHSKNTVSMPFVMRHISRLKATKAECDKELQGVTNSIVAFYEELFGEADHETERDFKDGERDRDSQAADIEPLRDSFIFSPDDVRWTLADDTSSDGGYEAEMEYGRHSRQRAYLHEELLSAPALTLILISRPLCGFQLVLDEPVICPRVHHLAVGQIPSIVGICGRSLLQSRHRSVSRCPHYSRLGCCSKHLAEPNSFSRPLSYYPHCKPFSIWSKLSPHVTITVALTPSGYARKLFRGWCPQLFCQPSPLLSNPR